MEHDDLPRARPRMRKAREQRIPLLTIIARLHAAPAAVETENERRLTKGTQHDREAAVVADVRRRLVPAAGEVEVADGLRVDDAQAVDPLRREVDAPAGRWRGGGEEHLLLSDERAVLVVEFVEEGHGAGW